MEKLIDTNKSLFNNNVLSVRIGYYFYYFFLKVLAWDILAILTNLVQQVD